ncbi:hypothetical protein BAMA_12420 [Bacillus manliponensis]|uniref:Group-specific protein n=1 Tax=Bacillus manliponensis TaxID=574376 RepID=A0A073JTN2_9BACI|nr:group-specific protein [Bacillus manliponensis]KEK17541.1 hypothetical protein BAMA_12420 [Bacillus manliponensis]
MISIQIDEQEVREMYLEKVEEKIKEVEVDLVFWDTNELKRRTCLSWGTIQKEFFFDPRFPKYKVGAKWLFPAQETKKFLLEWLSEQR